MTQEPNYQAISKDLLEDLKGVLARATSIPIIWPGQLPSRNFPAAKTYGLVSTTLSNETPISLGPEPVYRSTAQIVLRLMSALQANEVLAVRALAYDVKDKWKSQIKTGDIIIDGFSVADAQPEQGRIPVDVVLNYHYYT